MIPLSAWKLFCRGGDRLPFSSDVFRYFRSSDPDFGGLYFSLPVSRNVILSSAMSALPLGSPRPLSSGSEVSASLTLPSSAPQISAPAAVNPSDWESVGSGLGVGWDDLGSALLSPCTQNQVDHLCIFKMKLTTFYKTKLTRSFKKIQVVHGSKFKTQVDPGF